MPSTIVFSLSISLPVHGMGYKIPLWGKGLKEIFVFVYRFFLLLVLDIIDVLGTFWFTANFFRVIGLLK